MKHRALEIVEALQDQGFIAYWVGGCVRDIILRQDPKDYDIVTSATPDEIEGVFPQTKAVGKSFGVMLVRMGEDDFEVATFRRDGDYIDGRRPESVHFCSPEEDAYRRDFTINGIFYDPVKKKFIDFVKGRSDLRRGILRFIGDPHERIIEDNLRILRAIRFKNRFQLSYEKYTARALESHADLVSNIAPERISQELNSILVDRGRSSAFKDLDRFNIGVVLLPEIWDLKETPQPADHHQEGNVFNHSLDVIDQFRPGVSLECVWAGLLHDVGKLKTFKFEGARMTFFNHPQVGAEIVRVIGDRFKMSSQLINSIEWLVHHHHIFDQWDQMTLARKLHYFDHPLFQDLLNLHRADIFGSKPSNWDNRKFLRVQIEDIQREFYEAHRDENVPSAVPEFFTGEEIMEIMGIEPGARVGEIKSSLREMQLDGVFESKSIAADYLKSLNNL